MTWRAGNFGAGYYTSYVGSVIDTGATLADGTPFAVDDHMVHNLYLQYTVGDGMLDGLRVRAGVRNIFDTLAPIADASFGYIGDLYSNRGRSFYVSARKRF